MANFNTGNPPGSTDPRDLLDNSTIADHYVSDVDSENWPDRFGRARKTWHGIEKDSERLLEKNQSDFDAELLSEKSRFEIQIASQKDRFLRFLLSSGYQHLADYNQGPITFTERNQITAYDGQLYRVNADTELPYTTTGVDSDSWSTDVTHLVAIGEGDLRQEIGSVYGTSYIGEVASFSDLAALQPQYEGQKIKLSSWHEGYNLGGGEFVSVKGTKSDDGGVIAKVNDTWYWKRIGNPEDLDITDFGGLPADIPSLEYDCSVSLENYAKYLSSLSSPSYGAGMKIPTGAWNISQADLSSLPTDFPFRLRGGGEYEHGRQTPTMINLTGADDAYCITVNSHIVDMSQVGIYGGYDKGVNTRKFITSKTRPMWLRISKFYASYMGGVSLDFLDTLDSKLDQFYTEYTHDSFLRVLPSGTSAGSWLTSTAIELSNFNIQYHLSGSSAKPAILAPLCYYSVINNGWIEHSDYPANIAYGMWNITNLAIESTTNPVYAYMSRIRDVWGDYKLGTPIDYTLGAAEVAALNLTIPSWINDTRFANGGLIEQPSFVLNKGAEAHHMILPESRIGGGNGWYYLGVFSPQYVAHGMVIEIQGALGYNSDPTSKTSAAGSGSGTGVCKIRIQNKGVTTTPAVAWSNENSSGVAGVKWKLLNNSTKQIAIYIQITQYSNSMGIFVRSDSDAPNYQNGAVSYYTFSGSYIQDISTVADLITASAIHTIHNNTYGYGMNMNTGHMLFDTPVTYAEGASGQTRVLPIYNNGQRYNIPLSADGTRVPVYTKSALPSASGTNYYSLIVVSNGSSTGSTCLAYSNGTNWLRVSDNSAITNS
ncbi:hypothetical protein HH682_12210 [Rosenbergiella sp. S61]|uniref:Tail spike TSP1/Gp66 N-terminal domain-containing protein n=1 Tax=Rosenbergiella gaditana TaxID=2726987 RepID=A0ABS5SYQ3_9GAMM|nr:hypothetical protein [Rosenbergiella gaditana]MBT0725166.1 hypothetical protein [Rosenbergiella gaditana]